MHQFIYAFISVLSLYVQEVYLSISNASQFQFTEEARAALCPFVGTEGLRCFEEGPMKNSRGFFSFDYLKLPRGVGITVDRSNGQLKAPAIQLTYRPKGTSVWTDGFTGDMYDTFNEAIIGPASSAAAAYDRAQAYIFQNASELDVVWQNTFGNGQTRGGDLARPLDMLEHFKRLVQFLNELTSEH